MSDLKTEGRHPAIRDVARRFDTAHLTNQDARQISMEYSRLAELMLLRLKDDPETTRALVCLADSRDAAIRSKVYLP